MRLRALAPGKVNLCLFLGPTRDDGRHELVTLLQSCSRPTTSTRILSYRIPCAASQAAAAARS